MATLAQFLKSQLFITPAYPTTSFESKVVIITGANSGLGRDAAQHFVRLGAASVILAVRTISKGDEAKASIEAAEKCGNDVVSVWQLDLSSYDTVKAFAKRVENLPRVDVVVENAGIFPDTFSLLEGHESTVTTNVISTFLLALLVLPKLKETASTFKTRPRLTIVTSDTHSFYDYPVLQSPDIFKSLDEEQGADMAKRYPLTKLLQIMVVRELTDHVVENKATYPVVINSVTPGFCHSQLVDGVFVRIMKFLLARTTEVGSRTLVHAAGEVGDDSQGEYLLDCQITPPSPFVLSEDGRKTQARVWKELIAILEKIEPGISGRI